jgi:hypothetical protein
MLSEIYKNNRIMCRFIGQRGARSLAVGLENCTALEQLDLSENNIEDVGAEFIARSLVFATGLCTLDLAMNFIGHDGARHVQDMLMRNSRLTKLDLQVCLILYIVLFVFFFYDIPKRELFFLGAQADCRCVSFLYIMGGCFCCFHSMPRREPLFLGR